MKLLTKELERRLPPLYSMEKRDPKEVPVVVKFFDPCSQWTWYATEYDPKDRLFFGYVKGYDNEFGYFSLSELESVTNRFGLGIERDKYFGSHFLSEVLDGKVS